MESASEFSVGPVRARPRPTAWDILCSEQNFFNPYSLYSLLEKLQQCEVSMGKTDLANSWGGTHPEGLEILEAKWNKLSYMEKTTFERGGSFLVF